MTDRNQFALDLGVLFPRRRGAISWLLEQLFSGRRILAFSGMTKEGLIPARRMDFRLRGNDNRVIWK